MPSSRSRIILVSGNKSPVLPQCTFLKVRLFFCKSSAKLKVLAKGLSPSYLRMGGHDTNFLIFEKNALNKQDAQLEMRRRQRPKHPRSRYDFDAVVGLVRLDDHLELCHIGSPIMDRSSVRGQTNST